MKPFNKGPSCCFTVAYWGPTMPPDQHRLERHLVDRSHDADRVRRETTYVDDVGIGRLYGSQDRRKIDLVRRETSIVRDLQPIFLSPLTRARGGSLRKLGIGH